MPAWRGETGDARAEHGGRSDWSEREQPGKRDKGLSLNFGAGAAATGGHPAWSKGSGQGGAAAQALAFSLTRLPLERGEQNGAGSDL